MDNRKKHKISWKIRIIGWNKEKIEVFTGSSFKDQLEIALEVDPKNKTNNLNKQR